MQLSKDGKTSETKEDENLESVLFGWDVSVEWIQIKLEIKLTNIFYDVYFRKFILYSWELIQFYRILWALSLCCYIYGVSVAICGKVRRTLF